MTDEQCKNWLRSVVGFGKPIVKQSIHRFYPDTATLTNDIIFVNKPCIISSMFIRFGIKSGVGVTNFSEITVSKNIQGVDQLILYKKWSIFSQNQLNNISAQLLIRDAIFADNFSVKHSQLNAGRVTLLLEALIFCQGDN